MKWSVAIGSAIALLGLLAGPLTVWNALSSEQASQKERVSALEKRRQEDRDTYLREQGEIKNDVKDVKSDVQLILRKLDVMEDRRLGPARR